MHFHGENAIVEESFSAVLAKEGEEWWEKKEPVKDKNVLPSV